MTIQKEKNSSTSKKVKSELLPPSICRALPIGFTLGLIAMILVLLIMEGFDVIRLMHPDVLPLSLLPGGYGLVTAFVAWYISRQSLSNRSINGCANKSQ